jgi:hypothetical protein
MWQIEKEFDDYSHPIGKGWVNLKADKPMNPYRITYSITWSGFVSGNNVKIIRKRQSSYSLNDFDFSGFPEKYAFLKP